MKSSSLLAEFARPDEAARALQRLRGLGYERLESYGPFPLTEEDAEARSGWRGLGIVAFAAGTLGALAGYGVQWYVDARSYPLDVGGRPAHALTAFVPATFETTLLCAAVATFITLLVALRLPRLWQPLLEIDHFERTSVDRFWVAVDLADATAQPEATFRELTSMRPLRVLRVETDT